MINKLSLNYLIYYQHILFLILIHIRDNGYINFSKDVFRAVQKVFQHLKYLQYSFAGKNKYNASYTRYQEPNKPVKSNLNLKNSINEVKRLSDDMKSSDIYFYDRDEGKLFFKNDNCQYTVKLNLEVDEYSRETKDNPPKLLSRTKIGNSAIDADFLKLFLSCFKKLEKN